MVKFWSISTFLVLLKPVSHAESKYVCIVWIGNQIQEIFTADLRCRVKCRSGPIFRGFFSKIRKSESVIFFRKFAQKKSQKSQTSGNSGIFQKLASMTPESLPDISKINIGDPVLTIANMSPESGAIISNIDVLNGSQYGASGNIIQCVQIKVPVFKPRL